MENIERSPRSKQDFEEPCAVVPASTDLWEPRRSNPRGHPFRFNVETLKKGEGMSPGRYKVFITDAYESVAAPKNPEGESLRQLIDSKYASKEQTPWKLRFPAKKPSTSRSSDLRQSPSRSFSTYEAGNVTAYP